MLAIILFDGLNYAATLFLIAVGLTFVYGVLRVLNISHGALYAFGAYLATWITIKLLGLWLPVILSYFMLFAGAIIPGLILSTMYIIYILIRCWLRPQDGPAISAEERAAMSGKKLLFRVFKSLIPPMILILGVLGSIFAGIATPTEAAGVGAILAFAMTVGPEFATDMLRRLGGATNMAHIEVNPGLTATITVHALEPDKYKAKADGDYAIFREQELAAAINRLRTLKVKHQTEEEKAENEEREKLKKGDEERDKSNNEDEEENINR